MEKQTALKTILIISVAGLLFSGYLSFGELFQNTCPVGGCSELGGVPVCVFGFVMYLVVFVVSWLGIRKNA